MASGGHVEIFTGVKSRKAKLRPDHATIFEKLSFCKLQNALASCFVDQSETQVLSQAQSMV